MSANTLLISVDMIKARTPVHDNIDEKLVFPVIKVAQDMRIHPILGSSLFNKIVSDVGSGSITGEYKALLDEYIVDALVWWTLADLVMDISYQTWNKGVIRKQGDSTEVPDFSELDSLRNIYRSRGEYYAERLRLYLVANSKPDFIPEYYNGNTAINDLNPAGRAFEMPIYLGDDHECVHLDKNNCCGHDTKFIQ